MRPHKKGQHHMYYQIDYEYFDEDHTVIKDQLTITSINEQTAIATFWAAEWNDDLGTDPTITRIEKTTKPHNL